MGNNINEVYDQERIDVMTWLRFPLILGVVLIHSNLFAQVTMWNGTEPEWPEWLIYIFNNFIYLIMPSRVPILFIISGYFFFRSQKKIDKYFFYAKYKNRINSLLNPYIAWNTIAIIIQYIRFDVIADNNYTFLDYISGYWNFIPRNNDAPANMPLWFIRNLMVVSLLSPVLYQILKKRISAVVLLIMFSVFYITDINIPFAGLSNETILFFSIGACIAIYNIDFTKIPDIIGISTLLLYLPLQIIINEINENTYVTDTFIFITIIIKIVATFYIVSLLFKKKILKPIPELTKTSFLLYALHGIIIGILIRTLYLLFDSNNPIVLLGIYVLTPCIIIMATFIIYKTLSKYTPSLKRILLGNRI